ncbi:MAG: biotin--[acetyl-CoA-carboxylase] ligase [Bacteroidota bacterium]
MEIHNTLFVGKVLLHFPRLASTNEYAFKLLEKQTVVEGTVISTAEQFKGKGQLGNTWESTPNENIAMSVVFHPHFLLPTQQFYLNIAVAIAVRETLAAYTEGVQIKWSNDILINQKKVVGILIQNNLNAQQIQNSVVGIGINVNQQKFSPELEQASSLFLESGQKIDLEKLMQHLCKNLELRYLQLKRKHYEALRVDYFEHLFQYKEWAWYETLEGIPVKGKIVDVLETGQLVMQHNTSRRVYHLKEIRFLY